MLIDWCKKNNYTGVFPLAELWSDNEAMIAMVRLEKFKLKQFSDLDQSAKLRWQLDQQPLFVKGTCVKL